MEREGRDREREETHYQVDGVCDSPSEGRPEEAELEPAGLHEDLVHGHSEGLEALGEHVEKGF
eukprot:123343-Hanusia_phi.AAC.1